MTLYHLPQPNSTVLSKLAGNETSPWTIDSYSVHSMYASIIIDTSYHILCAHLHSSTHAPSLHPSSPLPRWTTLKPKPVGATKTEYPAVLYDHANLATLKYLHRTSSGNDILKETIPTSAHVDGVRDSQAALSLTILPTDTFSKM